MAKKKSKSTKSKDRGKSLKAHRKTRVSKGDTRSKAKRNLEKMAYEDLTEKEYEKRAKKLGPRGRKHYNEAADKRVVRGKRK